MFAAIGRFDVRFRWVIAAVWIAGVFAAVRMLPSLPSVTQSSSAQFLSSSAPSVQAGRLAAPFQGRANTSATAIIVASRASGPLTTADQAAIGRAEQAARQVPGVVLVRDQGTAPDGRAAQALVTVTAKTAGSDATASTAVDAIRAGFGKAGGQPGLVFHLTGPLAVMVDAANTHSGAIVRFTPNSARPRPCLPPHRPAATSRRGSIRPTAPRASSSARTGGPSSTTPR
jgi:putative drug exporter of the RND superfamily